MKNEIYEELNIKEIEFDKYQPRQLKDIQTRGGSIEGLAQSIKERGQHIPIIVAPFIVNNDGNTIIGGDALRKRGVKYWLIDGERRIRALKMLGENKVKSLIRLKLDEITLLEIQFEINSKREAVNPVDMAKSFERYINRVEEDEVPRDEAIQKLAKLTGMSTIFIKSRLLILNESKEMQDHIRDKSKRANAIAEIINAERVFKNEPELQEVAGRTLRNEFLTNDKKSTLDTRVAKVGFKKIKRMENISLDEKKKMIGVVSKELKITEDIEHQDEHSNFDRYHYDINSWKDAIMLWNLSELTPKEFDKLISIAKVMYDWIMNARKPILGAKTKEERAMAGAISE